MSILRDTSAFWGTCPPGESDARRTPSWLRALCAGGGAVSGARRRAAAVSRSRRRGAASGATKKDTRTDAVDAAPTSTLNNRKDTKMGKTTKNATKLGKPATDSVHTTVVTQAHYDHINARRAAVPAPILGGSYAGIVRRLKHPHRPDDAMLAKGIVLLLETNHFDAAMMVTHGLADLMDDYCLRVAERRV